MPLHFLLIKRGAHGGFCLTHRRSAGDKIGVLSGRLNLNVKIQILHTNSVSSLYYCIASGKNDLSPGVADRFLAAPVFRQSPQEDGCTFPRPCVWLQAPKAPAYDKISARERASLTGNRCDQPGEVRCVWDRIRPRTVANSSLLVANFSPPRGSPPDRSSMASSLLMSMSAGVNRSSRKSVLHFFLFPVDGFKQ